MVIFYFIIYFAFLAYLLCSPIYYVFIGGYVLDITHYWSRFFLSSKRLQVRTDNSFYFFWYLGRNKFSLITQITSVSLVVPRIRIESVLVKSNVLSEVQRSVLDGGLRVEDAPIDSSLRSGSLPPHLSAEKASPELSSSNTVIGGPSGLWHFIYRSINLDQYVSSEFSSPLSSSSQQKRCLYMLKY